ncbi:MAG TPA: radical SAM protein [Acidimicrobiaceae bacterium]|nr:radical SAM protein [Acidimicrobiaceae bacterium]
MGLGRTVSGGSNLQGTPVELDVGRKGSPADRIEVPYRRHWPLAGPDERVKVLLIYPNYRGMNMLPPAIGLLSACLLESGHEVELFDTTYYASVDEDDGELKDSDGKKSDQLMARPFEMPIELTLKTSDVLDDFAEMVDRFKPDILALSCTEDMWHLGLRLLRHQRSRKEILTIAGGVFPTFAPELVLGHDEVDIVCKGEGEDALRLLADRVGRGEDYADIPNLWTKLPDGTLQSNPIEMVDMNANPLIDLDHFEEARFYRPMGGRVWRMFPVETHRGCPYKCAFCNSPSQMAMYRNEIGENYLRRKTFENMFRELTFYKEEMGAEYLYFWADTFFSWKPGEFETFAEMYEDIDLPFWCQTRVETVEYERLKRLKEIGCARISFGLEHGNEEFRATWLKRRMSNELIVDNFAIVNEVDIPFSVNNILGFPHETRELAFDTIRLNRKFKCSDRNAYAFTPFHGTPLREECERLGYLEDEDIVRSMVTDGTPLDMPQFPRSQVLSLVKTFNMYVRFEEERWPEVELAEQDTTEGREKYEELRQEFVARFWSAGPSTSFEEASASV